MSSLAFVLLAVLEAPQAGQRTPAGWVVRTMPSSNHEWDCANKAKDQWVVAAEQEHLSIVKQSSTPVVVTLPFTPELAPGEAPSTFRGVQAVEPVDDGYLAGFSRGEFGGGLYWFSPDGAKHVKISPPTASWFPENVRGIAKDGRTFYVFQGLAHLRAWRGRVLKVQKAGAGWAGTVLVDLGMAPAAVIQEVAGTWLVVGSSGLVRVTSRGTADRVWTEDKGGYLNPNSVVRTSDGVVYLGMRAWVVRLKGVSPGPPVADLLAPASCAAFSKDCACEPQKAAGP
jgi:hypothetical protein